MMNIQTLASPSLFAQGFYKPIVVIIFLLPVLVAVIMMHANSRAELIGLNEKAQSIENSIRKNADNAMLYHRYKEDFASLMLSQDTPAGNRLRWQKSIDDGLLKFSANKQDVLENSNSHSRFALDRRERWNASGADYGDIKSTKLPSVYAAQAEFELTLANENQAFQLLYDLLISKRLMAHIESCQLQLINISAATSRIAMACDARMFDFDWSVPNGSGSQSDARFVESQTSHSDKVFLENNRRLLGYAILKNEPAATPTVTGVPVDSASDSNINKSKDQKVVSTALILNQVYRRSSPLKPFVPLINGRRANYFLGQRVTRIWNDSFHKEDKR